MRELTLSDMDQASGGVVPIFALGVALGSLAARGYLGAFLGGVGAGIAISDVKDYFAEN